MNPEQASRFHRSISEWLGTPYISGQSIAGKGGGVDCVRFCDCVLQDTFGLSLKPLPPHAQDAAFHSKEIVQETLRLLFDRFELYSVGWTGNPDPYDLVVVRQVTKTRPTAPVGHHVLLKGIRKRSYYDAWPLTGVREIGDGSLRSSFEVLKVYRSQYARTT